MPVYAGYESDEVRRAIKKKEEPSYQGTFTSAVSVTCCTHLATTQSPLMKKRVSQYMLGAECPGLSWQAASTRSLGSEVWGNGHCGDVSFVAQAAGRNDAALC